MSEVRMKIIYVITLFLICVGASLFDALSAGEKTQVTVHEADEYHTHWSPDGTMIGYTSKEML
jgi:hypothetical protein